MATLNPLTSSNPTSAGSPAGSGYTAAKPFLTPWLDYATTAMPDNHETVMWWAQHMWVTDGNYNTAMSRVAAHFITEVDFPDLDPSEESAWIDLYKNKFDYKSALTGCGHDYLAYGNLIVALYLPFRRYLRCPGCGLEGPVEKVPYHLELSSVEPYVRWHRKRACPKCGSTQDFRVIDRRDADLSRIRLNRLDPSDVELRYNRFSGRYRVDWRIPEEERRAIMSKADIHIWDTPMEVLEAVARNGRLALDPDMVLHIANPTISGMRNFGWGTPRCISNFRTAWLQQLTNKLDQAVAIDYTTGLRVLSPQPTTGGEDPLINRGSSEFVQKVSQMVNTQRNNPTSFYTSPFPINYQFLGGEGQNLLPHEKLKFRQQEYLNQLGVPLEYHQMNLSSQAAPMSLRLFEAYWHDIPAMYNKVLAWLTDAVSRVYGLDSTKVEMRRTTIVDDIEYKNILMQLMSANQISPETALRPLGIDAHEEVKQVMNHQGYVADVQRDFDEREMRKQEMGVLRDMVSQPTPSTLAAQQQQQDPAAAQAAGMGGMPMGGMPGPSDAPQSIQGLADQAQMIAEQLAPLTESERAPELKALRESNKELHALVMQKLEDIRNEAASAGKDMILQQGGM